MKRWLPPLLAAALVAVLAIALLRGNPENDGGPLVGKPAPNFALTALDGTKVNLAQYRGRPVVLNFWASWCGPCREEAPLLSSLSKQQSEGGLVVIGVLFQDKAADAQKFRQDFGLAFPSALDPKADTAIEYGVSGVPETFFIDKDGVVRKHVPGELNEQKARDGLKEIGATL